MSNLEAKAKSPIKIAYDYFHIPQKIDNSPWVPEQLYLDAQKEIERLNKAYLLLNNSLSECAKTGKKYLDETEALEAKIEAVNKHITKYPDTTLYRNEGTYQASVKKWLEELTSILIPRNREQNIMSPQPKPNSPCPLCNKPILDGETIRAVGHQGCIHVWIHSGHSEQEISQFLSCGYLLRKENTTT